MGSSGFGGRLRFAGFGALPVRLSFECNGEFIRRKITKISQEKWSVRRPGRLKSPVQFSNETAPRNQHPPNARNGADPAKARNCFSLQKNTLSHVQLGRQPVFRGWPNPADSGGRIWHSFGNFAGLQKTGEYKMIKRNDPTHDCHRCFLLFCLSFFRPVRGSKRVV
ncbi:MAG: hypothetical protein D6714_19810 [Bacteroidetes bacterium]|nr:MAG: hypothetical protein D6714_19810 [Bacteroidota bacterium]